MNVIEMTKKINAANFSGSELNQLISNIREIVKTNIKMELFEGMNVYVVQKTKKTPGVIVKVNKSRCVVEMNGAKYNVPMSMLEAA